jgi:hypothetical protein
MTDCGHEQGKASKIQCDLSVIGSLREHVPASSHETA